MHTRHKCVKTCNNYLYVHLAEVMSFSIQDRHCGFSSWHRFEGVSLVSIELTMEGTDCRDFPLAVTACHACYFSFGARITGDFLIGHKLSI